MGRGMVRLGQMLGIQGLSGLGVGWIRQAHGAGTPAERGSARPASCTVLRDLLREFREGDLERALRRALPAGRARRQARGAGAFAGDRLPPRDLSYALNDFLGRHQPGGIWLGGQDVMAELTREYRKAAEQAVRQGDYPVAHGVNLRQAPPRLSRGRAGVAPPAAGCTATPRSSSWPSSTIARVRRGPSRRPARSIRAVQLYRQVGDHVAAGDLLHRIGEEEAALAEYRSAADRLIQTGAGSLAAGDLLLNKAGRADLAMALFAAGWARRPEINAVPAPSDGPAPRRGEGSETLLALLDQADAFFDPPGNDHAAGEFYNATTSHDWPIPRVASPRATSCATGHCGGLPSSSGSMSRAARHGGAIVSTLLARPGPASSRASSATPTSP